MSNYYNQRLLVGNCLDTLKQLADDSIDSVVTDPPYELGFMGKSWDSTGIAFNIAVWQECMRVLKPGGHLLAFSGSRTYHRMAVAIEDAGFEIRDQIMWIYGSGFPKSHNVSKGIDKAAGAERNEILGWTNKGMPSGSNKAVGHGAGSEPTPITAASTPAAKQWQGWGTALKPAHEPIVVARKPISMKTVAENVLTYGTGAINIDASRVGFVSDADKKESTDKNQHADFGTKPITNNTVYGDYSMIEPKNYQPTGRFPANLILSHNPDCQEISEATLQSELPKEVKGGIWQKGTGNGKPAGNTYTDTPAVYNCTEGCPFLEFPNAGKGNNGKPFNYSGTEYNNKDTSLFNGDKPEAPSNYNDNGTAARFFYCAKTSKSERNAGLEGLPKKQVGTYASDEWSRKNMGNTPLEDRKPVANIHPTVKPLTLMRYLIKLVTPPNGTVLDPFLGSGSTAVAAVLDGFNWKGCEMTEDYLPIIKGRVEHALAEVKKAKQKKESTPTLFEEDKVEVN